MYYVECPGTQVPGAIGGEAPHRVHAVDVVERVPIAAVGVAFLISLMTFIAFLSQAEPHYQASVFPWIAAGDYSAQVGFLIDGLSCTMASFI